MILKFYREDYFSDTEACQGLHLFPLCDDVRSFSPAAVATIAAWKSAPTVVNVNGRGVVGRGTASPHFFDRGTRHPLPHLFGLKFVQNLVHFCNWLLTETQCKIISVQQNQYRSATDTQTRVAVSPDKTEDPLWQFL